MRRAEAMILKHGALLQFYWRRKLIKQTFAIWLKFFS
jgi:hypothetical protein